MGVCGQAGAGALRDRGCGSRYGGRSVPAGRTQAADQDALREPRDARGGAMTKQAHALREKSVDELHTRERELTEQLFKLRFQRATGRMENPSKMRQVRQEIARIQTLLKEKASA